MITNFPLEIIEKILFFLHFEDILSVFSAFNNHYSILSDFFWKTICLREDFLQAFENQQWYNSFQCGVNKKLGHYVRLNNVPVGVLEHIYLSSLVVRDTSSINSHNVYFLDNKNKFTLTQTITEETVYFKQEFILVKQTNQCIAYIYNFNSKQYDLYKLLQGSADCVFGISSKYCLANFEAKLFNVYYLNTDEIEKLFVPQDVKFLIEKVLHNDSLVISALTFREGYKIKVYDLLSRSWNLDIFCFNSTGISNDPNVWVGSSFIGCCSITYRLHGNYYGPFKVWNKEGKKLFQKDIEPSSKHYLRCFFKEEYIILTTTDSSISIFNKMGETISKLFTSFSDVILSSGHLLFVVLEENSIDIIDWSSTSHLYSIQIKNKCRKSLYSEFLLCPISYESNNYEVIKFFS